MGVVDTLLCELDVPGLPKKAVFTTKDLFCHAATLVITPDGRLMNESKYGVRESRRDLEYHGDILARGSDKDKRSFEYAARFTHGQLEWFRPASELPEFYLEMLRLRG